MSLPSGQKATNPVSDLCGAGQVSPINELSTSTQNQKPQSGCSALGINERYSLSGFGEATNMKLKIRSSKKYRMCFSNLKIFLFNSSQQQNRETHKHNHIILVSHCINCLQLTCFILRYILFVLITLYSSDLLD